MNLSILRRTGHLLYDNCLALLLLLIFSFIMMHFLPGNQVDVMLSNDFNSEVSSADYDGLMNVAGLDKPVWMQFFNWMISVIKGHLGYSYIYSASVSSLILNAIPWTLMLIILSLPLSLLSGTLLGLTAGMNADKFGSKLIFSLVTLISSLPGFVIALLLLSLLGFYFNWFPCDGGAMSLEAKITGEKILSDILWHGALPLLALSVQGSIRYFYLAYGLALQIQRRPFIFYAKMRGIKGVRLLWYWFFPNAMPEILSRLSTSLPGMVGATIFVEVVFSYPGAGSLMLDAINNRDYVLVQGCLLMIGGVVLVCNTVLDLFSRVLAERG